MKCGLLHFTKKVISRKELRFPENSEFFEIHNFRQNAPKVTTHRRKFPGIWIPQVPKMQEYMGFPAFSSQNSDFSREIFVKILNFHENRGSTFSRIPGNFGRQNAQKCRNIRVSPNSRAKIQIFPGKFLAKFGIFTKFRGHPSRNSREFWSKKPRKMQKYTGFTPFWG